MEPMDADDALDLDPLGARLVRLVIEPASPQLLARVVAGIHSPHLRPRRGGRERTRPAGAAAQNRSPSV
jgi:hypothetical protein